MSYTVLLVEDNPKIMHANGRMLQLEGYETVAAATLHAARKEMEQALPDLVVLDIMMPDGSGLDFCKEIHTKYPRVPVLFLTALGENHDVVKGLRAGGDDYLSKPYDFQVLLARIEALLRRTQAAVQNSSGQSNLQAGPFCFDRLARRVYRNGQDALLKPKEYALFLLLCENRGSFLSPETIYARIWGADAYGDVRTVYAHISRLRSKLKLQDNAQVVIEQKRGKGYRLVIKG